MDMYVKQLVTEIKEKKRILMNKFDRLSNSLKKVFSEAISNISEYEKYYQLIKIADNEKVSPGNLPFSVYSRPDSPKKEPNDDESEHISNVLEDNKKVFDRKLQVLKSEAIAIEQVTDEFTKLIKDINEYYEDLIESVKF